jgi:hypothetical protein
MDVFAFNASLSMCKDVAGIAGNNFILFTVFFLFGNFKLIVVKPNIQIPFLIPCNIYN